VEKEHFLSIFVRSSQQDGAKRAQTLERKRAKALFVQKIPGLSSLLSRNYLLLREILLVWMYLRRV
jgi:hypothetical protein